MIEKQYIIIQLYGFRVIAMPQSFAKS